MDYIKASKKTAITRKKPSVPTRWIESKGGLFGECLDYGCGKGLDADVYRMDKYDPNYFPEKPDKQYDTIVCNYVLNVLLEKERDKVMQDIGGMLKESGVAYFSVRRDAFKEGWSNNKTYQEMVYLDLMSVKSTAQYQIYRGRKCELIK